MIDCWGKASEFFFWHSYLGSRNREHFFVLFGATPDQNVTFVPITSRRGPQRKQCYRNTAGGGTRFHSLSDQKGTFHPPFCSDGLKISLPIIAPRLLEWNSFSPLLSYFLVHFWQKDGDFIDVPQKDPLHNWFRKQKRGGILFGEVYF